MWNSYCRRALQEIYGVQRCQRRTFLNGSIHYTWKSPVSCGKIKDERTPIPVPPAVTTLDPIRLKPENYFDISTSSLNQHLQFRKLSTKHYHDPHHRQFGDQLTTSDIRFPPDLRGFLYYYAPPNQNPLGSGVRFRVAEGPDTHSFVEGHDLLMPHGIPWQLPIIEIMTLRKYAGLRNVLAADGFAPPQLKLACDSVQVVRDSVFISALGMPWAVDWRWEFSRVYVVSPDRRPLPLLVKHPWFRRGSVYSAPNSGRGLVSLVKDADGNSGLRVDKVLSLIQHNINTSAMLPAEGQVTPFSSRLILKQTKMSEAKMDEGLSHYGPAAFSKLPWIRGNRSPLEVFRHFPLPKGQLEGLSRLMH
ncbi:hypothetical protein C8R44DRAFT_8054 [Mycena epipterygia]|nr:hypothetical protein C8R44DRAFT_8054 [Mycena epipterygia]